MEDIRDILKECHKESDLRKKMESERQNSLVEVLFGNMIFEFNTATVLTIDKRVMCKVKDLDDFCENGLDIYECYLVPSEFKGKIVYSN
jgi:hypothetical protein